MLEKWFVLVSQGMEIFRTKSQEVAINEVKKSNDDWFEYCQRCADNYERPADNYISLEIEYKDEEEVIRKDERKRIKDFILCRGEMNEAQILKELMVYLNKAE